MKDVGLLNTHWAMIISSAISVYNMLIVRNYFSNSIPGELQEAATLDGANTAQYLLRIVIPLSNPVIAVVGLYYGVSHWNNYYNALVYIYNQDLFPLQSQLRDILMTNQLLDSSGNSPDLALVEQMLKLDQTLKYSAIIAAAIPVLCIYPFIQKFFVKGIMIGCVKG